MEKSIERLKRLIQRNLPECVMSVDTPNRAGGNWMIDVTMGKRGYTLEYRPGKGFGLFQEDAGYGEGPAEIYRTPERTAQRLAQLMAGRGSGKGLHLKFKDIRELYGLSQDQLARKVGIKQSAVSRFENRDEVKLSTLAAAVEALGGKLEVRAHFADSDVPISLATSKG